MREDINTFAQRIEHATSNMAIVVLLSHGEDGLVFGTGEDENIYFISNLPFNQFSNSSSY